MPMFPKKTVYHSAMVAAGEIEINVTSGAVVSKFNKEGESGHLFVEFEFEGYVHQYFGETDECARELGKYKGETVLAKALPGDRKNDPWFEIRPVSGSRRPPAGRDERPEPARGRGNDRGNDRNTGRGNERDEKPELTREEKAAIAWEKEQQAFKDLKRLIARRAVAYHVCVRAAAKIIKDNPELNESDLREIATHISIGLEKSAGGLLNALPVFVPDAPKKEEPPQRAEPRQEPPPEPVRQPEPEPEPDNDDDAAADADIPF